VLVWGAGFFTKKWLETVGAWRERMPEPSLLDFAIHRLDLIRLHPATTRR